MIDWFVEILLWKFKIFYNVLVKLNKVVKEFLVLVIFYEWYYVVLKLLVYYKFMICFVY